MINKKSKTALQFILGGIMLASFTITGCNNNDTATKEAPKDATMDNATERPIVPTNKTADTPAVKDSMDKANERPIVPTNKTPN